MFVDKMNSDDICLEFNIICHMAYFVEIMGEPWNEASVILN